MNKKNEKHFDELKTVLIDSFRKHTKMVEKGKTHRRGIQVRKMQIRLHNLDINECELTADLDIGKKRFHISVIACV